MKNRAITSQKAKRLDVLAQTRYGIPGIVMMELAGRAVYGEAKRMLGEYPQKRSVAVVCGTGNNGGDGFVAARHLDNNGISVEVFIVGDSRSIKGDAGTNLSILKNINVKISLIKTRNDADKFAHRLKRFDLLIDAIFGIGLAREVAGLHRDVIEIVNESDRPVVAIDVPSGLNSDNGLPQKLAVKAKRTVTMGVIKAGLCADPGRRYAGKVIVADISLPRFLFKRGAR